jgi:hypothetical protein
LPCNFFWRIRRPDQGKPSQQEPRQQIVIADCPPMEKQVQTDRSSARRRVLKTAQISFKRGGAAIDCTIRDISEHGAALKVVSSVGIPDLFDLAIVGSPARPCRLVWRKAAQIGVAFL